jgi:lipoate-protein ligase A
VGTQLYRNSFPTAAQNMTFDGELLTKTLHDKETRIRLYCWESPGITYPRQRPIAPEWETFDHGERPSGGGLVFHMPGDVVWAIATPITKGSTLSSYIEHAITWIERALLPCNIELHSHPQSRPADIRYCNTYESPFERYLGTEKVLGIALRRHRSAVLLQGVIHLTPNQPYFDPQNNYPGIWTRGLGGQDLAGSILKRLLDTV